MVMSYSPHRDAGGTLHLPSPTHLHHIDSASALRQLRRSLSRSPSKGPTFRLVMSKSTSPSPNSPLSPSPLSPHLKRESYSPLNEKTFASTTPFAIPFPPTIKKSRSNNRKISPMRTGSRSRSSHRSPVRRGLSDCTDNGNATPSSSPNQSLGAENEVTGSVSPVEKLEFDGALPSLTGRGLDSSLAPSHAWTRFERGNGCVVGFAAKSSPLKRSDGIMNIDHTGLGSPSAKRRSLHGGTFGPDFDIFEHEAVLSAQDQQTGEAQIAEDQGSQESTSNFSPMPRRTSSLRKTTLQQRHEKPLFTRSKPNAEITMDHTSQGPTLSKSRPRMSLENFLPQPVRDSPFSSQGTLPSASIHPICQQRKEMAISSLPQRHPLSRTISQSSNGSSMAEDSPTHVPIRLPEQRKMHVDFSRSLPVGATRPFTRESLSRETSGQSSATEFSFSTPENYKLAKPLPAAFMSTGLISKRNVNIEETQADLRSSNAHMPETPCKRPTSMATIAPIPVPDSVIGNAKHARRSLHSFGTPSTPYNPHTSQPTPGSFGKGTSIFGSNFATGGLVRKGSFASIEVDENSQFSSGPSNSQSSNDNGIQPTPTKNLPEVSSSPFPKSAERDTSFQWAVDHIPTLSPVGHLSSHSRQRSELSPLASPINEFHEQKSPHTPQESALPPDPSGLSISAHGNQPASHERSSSTFKFPPATPTTPRDYFLPSGRRRSSITPAHSFPALDVDSSLTSRFDGVELVGTGEFSQVYRVTQKEQQSNVAHPIGRPPPKPSVPDRVWAVKKSRQPYGGSRDRKHKLNEVAILKALGRSDHTVQLFDHWELKNHLYIQTEFCDEGSLDVFLEQAGRKARLDDFRIWKIMLELSQGLKHIHDSGIIHLDLKPANILITFEGVLKIADFGMASSWPAQANIDGEGDREYIGPEILMGHYDKPSDIFALGLIMLEIAGNVVLPDNGLSWQRLRTGDMSDVPSLTWSSEASNIFRDASGKPLSLEGSHDDVVGTDHAGSGFGSVTDAPHPQEETYKLNRVHLSRSGELVTPPSFMTDPNHEQTLDTLVRWMISPLPADRPVVDQVLSTTGIQWVENRRRAGATIYEGNWGPADEILADDAEMIDI